MSNTITNTLPNEMLVYVASFLVYDNRARCAFSRVCHLFCGVAHDVFDQEPAFQHACGSGYMDIVQQFFADGCVDPAANDNLAIRLSSLNGRSAIVRLLLTDGRVDPTVNDNNPIRLSSQNGHPDVVKLLLADPRVDPAADNNFALRISSDSGHADVIKLLVADERVDSAEKMIPLPSEKYKTEFRSSSS